MDKIKGKVIDIIDGDTFEIKVTLFEKENEFKYYNKERILINEFDEQQLNTNFGERTKEKLEQLLIDKEVHVSINSRDKEGRIVGKIKII